MHEDLFRVYLIRRESWLDHWAVQLTGNLPLQRRERRSTKRFLREIERNGKGIPVKRPCKHCAVRKTICTVHVDLPFGGCLECIRGVRGHKEWTECARSRGLTDNEIIGADPVNPFIKEDWTFNILKGLSFTSFSRLLADRSSHLQLSEVRACSYPVYHRRAQRRRNYRRRNYHHRKYFK